MTKAIGSKNAPNWCERTLHKPLASIGDDVVSTGIDWLKLKTRILPATITAYVLNYREEDGAAAVQPAEIVVRVDLGRGHDAARVWTCDFSYEYVKINADYRS